ncbi:MAG: tRNA (guanosine(46)-N7)-methyltransferase TrmB [Vicingaceae bacterium]
MGNKKKLVQFAELTSFSNVLEVGFDEVLHNDHPLKGKWHNKIFSNKGDIVLELGCGKGEYSVGMGKCYPEKNFIGVDIKGARMWRGAKTALEEGLNNVFFLRSRIDFISSFFEKGEISEIWLTFPDPQMRSSKERKRLTSDRFLDMYLSVLKPKGTINLKTDSDFLYEYSLEKARERGMAIQMAIPNIYAQIAELGLDKKEKEILAIRSHYERLFTAQGHMISFLRIASGGE